MADEQQKADLTMAHEDLYHEELFTDRRVGTIQRLTPVTKDGGPDTTRSVIYVGQTQILTPAGGLPITFEIDAGSLGEATRKFAESAEVAIEDTMKRLEEMRREAASSIIVPGSGGAAGGVPGGGVPGGGLKVP
ncbi:MAG: hypothetical protein JSW21_01700 [Gammaproteobacteria bacterium]|nr:MAG: hypothetical protein JSW21_01700 [Gammaproteobacteria bacterium]